MGHIKAVIKQTSTPSWINSVPYNFGDSVAGTLKADEWRTLATIYLPIALVTIWGDGSEQSSPELAEQFREILDHTMALVSAVCLVCRRSVSDSRATAYRENIAYYIGGISKLYPHINHRPNHHAAFHIYDFMRLFGPVHSWWCFPFERVIGILQRIPSNHKFGESDRSVSLTLFSLFAGEMEATLLHSFVKGGNLRRWLSRPNCPPVIKECKLIFDKAFSPKKASSDGSGFEMEGEFSEAGRKPRSVPEDLRQLVPEQQVLLQARIKLFNAFFTSVVTHVRNSLVMFYPDGNKSLSPIPASISYIYTRGNKKLFAVRRQLPRTAQDKAVDPFLKYPHFPAKLYNSKMSTNLEAVELDWVLGHYVRWNMPTGYAVVLPITKVVSPALN